MLFIGIDAGGGHTRAVLVDADGVLLASGLAGASGAIPGARGRRMLQQALKAALAPIAPRVRHDRTIVHVGLRGLSMPGRRDAALVELSALMPNAQVHISSDATIALHGALAGRQGVAILAGTGSIAIARSEDGRESRAGGYGYLLGDEGSAFWLGREAVRASLAASERREPATALADALPARGLELVSWLYSDADHVQRLAGLAPLVTAAAAAGDATALQIVRTGANALAQQAAAAAHQLWPAQHVPEGLEVARCGAVWRAGAILLEPFRAELQARVPGARPVEARLAPVAGAALLAMQIAGIVPVTFDGLRAASRSTSPAS